MTTKEKRSDKHSLIHVEPYEPDDLGIDEFFTTKFDYVVKRDMYKAHKKTLAIYDLLRQILVDKNKDISTPIITLSPDPSISASTLAGAAEKFMYSDINPKTGATVFKTNLKVLYFDSSPDVSTQKYDNYDSFRESVLSDAMGLNDESFSLHRVDIPPENITIMGVDDKNIDDAQEGIVKKYNIDMFSSRHMRKKGIVKFMKRVLDSVENDDVHVVIDLSCMQQKYAPSSIRNDTDKKAGFDFDEMRVIMNSLKNLKKLNGVDITGYNFGSRKDKNKHHVSNIITVKTIEMMVSSVIVLKQKSINIFNENSKFLIWRKVQDTDPIGWYILRGISLQDREQFIEAIGDGQIVTITIPESDDVPKDDSQDDNLDDNPDDNTTTKSKKSIKDDLDDDDDSDDDSEPKYFDALVTVTTLKEQQDKSYYMATSLQECCLYPGEKLNMMFELLNTPNVQQAQAKEYSDNGTDDTTTQEKPTQFIQYSIPADADQTENQDEPIDESQEGPLNDESFEDDTQVNSVVEDVAKVSISTEPEPRKVLSKERKKMISRNVRKLQNKRLVRSNAKK
ncbi:hypothetical protein YASMINEVIRUS_289 [Yasminevirus sp. GU-2018]|uniref:Uncharacterized protein n=1 Tax=Yasminevirus sp. GU-2018 TaxID=2420051 RepID=A0A5K0U9N4_9VIRU|nr:hypothetical protein YASMINEVIRUS_289 [Yasminevirus sp. GU-2018]